jgi:hypothetical protein
MLMLAEDEGLDIVHRSIRLFARSSATFSAVCEGGRQQLEAAKQTAKQREASSPSQAAKQQENEPIQCMTEKRNHSFNSIRRMTTKKNRSKDARAKRSILSFLVTLLLWASYLL